MYSERVLVTILLKPRDAKYHCERADAASAKEVASLEARGWIRWGTLPTIDAWEQGESEVTWSLAQMLTSEKFTELRLCETEAVLKGRCVHMGCKEWYHLGPVEHYHYCSAASSAVPAVLAPPSSV